MEKKQDQQQTESVHFLTSHQLSEAKELLQKEIHVLDQKIEILRQKNDQLRLEHTAELVKSNESLLRWITGVFLIQTFTIVIGVVTLVLLVI